MVNQKKKIVINLHINLYTPVDIKMYNHPSLCLICLIPLYNCNLGTNCVSELHIISTRLTKRVLICKYSELVYKIGEVFFFFKNKKKVRKSTPRILSQAYLLILFVWQVMGRTKSRKTGIEATAFEPPFYKPSIGLNSYKIPENYETKLLDLYTEILENTQKSDITKDELEDILETYFMIPKELILQDNDLDDWLIEGTDVVDFEKWLYNGYFWLLLKDKISIVDMIWKDICSALDTGNDLLTPNKLREKKIYLTDVRKLIEIGKMEANCIGMLQTISNGKVYINFVDFFILLGRLGVFN